jgi:FYVE/RhoGEF/PH domain-containing protein 5/6
MANDSGSQMSGWLFRREKRKSWKRFWFVLKEQVLYAYKASEDVVALNTIPVLGYSIQTFPEVSILLSDLILISIKNLIIQIF